MALASLIYNYRVLFILIVLITVLIFICYKKFTVTTLQNPKYIICYPQGTLINMLRCIMSAYNYARKYERVLIIDSRNNWFKESIYDYFFIHCPYVYVGDIDFLYTKLNTLSMYPEKQDLLKREISNIRKYNIHLDRDYDENIIMYSYNGGDKSVLPFFQLVSLKPSLLKEYKTARDRLPSSYVGVHINEKAEEFLTKHGEKLKGKSVFIGSRDRKIVDIFKREVKAIAFSDLPHSYVLGEPIGVDIHRYNTDMCVDLLLLASSSEFYFGESDFAFLAKELHDDPVLLKRLLTVGLVKD